jgi:hypothetical protein
LLPTATPDERKLILGYDTKSLPELPGQITPKVHVEGTLERLKAKRADLERIRPLLVAKVEKYLGVIEALKPWPHWRISEIRNQEAERRLIAKGKPIQRRGPQ